jgi:hypothetical protein
VPMRAGIASRPSGSIGGSRMQAARPISVRIRAQKLCPKAVSSAQYSSRDGQRSGSRITGAILPSVRQAPRTMRRDVKMHNGKKITQASFTEKAWQAIVAAPEVPPVTFPPGTC